MLGRSLVLTLVVLAATAASSRTEKMVGVNFLNGQWSHDAYDSAAAAASFALLRNQTESNTVALSFAFFQPSIHVPGPIAPGPTSPSHAQLAAAVNRAHAAGMDAILRPLVDPDWANPANAGTWRGQIGRSFSAAQWATWFESYTAFVLPFARMAETLGTRVFCVGAELVAASHQADAWRAVVAAVRAVYSGKIMYAANHGNELAVAWWDHVDIIGIDAYYTLWVDAPVPTVHDVMRAWTFVRDELAILSAAHAKPIFFAEIGYCSVPLPFIDPAHCLASAPLDLAAQAMAYDAALSVFLPEPWFLGITWWDWATAPDGGSNGTDTGFSPANKPAAAVLKAHILRAAASEPAGRPIVHHSGEESDQR